jgi:hypothetical protein
MSTFVNCPTCGATVKWSEDQPWRPFCSDRCRLIDLGKWASEEHRITSEETPFSEDTTNDLQH